MPVAPSPLERWFTTHPGPFRHSLAATAVGAPAWEALAPRLGAFSPELGYGEPAGDPGLRARLAAHYGVAPEQVLLAHGAADANWLALAALLGPGDRVVCQWPIYPQLACMAAHTGATVERWDAPDLEALEALLTPSTRLVILNSPHNPTGRVFDEATLRAVAARVEALPDAYLLVDEVYRELGPVALPRSAVALSSRALITNSTSKAWALPGPRVGWLVGPAAVIAAALPYREHTTLALSSLSEGLVAALWDQRDALVAEAQALASRNRAIVREWLAGQPHLEGQVSDAAGCFLLRPPAPFDDLAACEAWARDERALVIPGSTLGYPGTLRVGFGHRDAGALEQALAWLAERLKPA